MIEGLKGSDDGGKQEEKINMVDVGISVRQC